MKKENHMYIINYICETGKLEFFWTIGYLFSGYREIMTSETDGDRERYSRIQYQTHTEVKRRTLRNVVVIEYDSKLSRMKQKIQATTNIWWWKPEYHHKRVRE